MPIIHFFEVGSDVRRAGVEQVIPVFGAFDAVLELLLGLVEEHHHVLQADVGQQVLDEGL
jgi:hypothetical protein